MTGEPYGGPPAPWYLRGQMHASLWRIRVADLPPDTRHAVQPLRFAGHALLVTAWADYAPGGTLAYREFLAATAVRGPAPLALAGTVGPIWVDDELAAAGGRVLWKIPKQRGSFRHAAGEGGGWEAELSEDGELVAALRFRPSRAPGLPLRLTVWTVQPDAAGPVRTRCVLRGTLRHGAAQWSFAATGPLAFLCGRTPILSARLSNLAAQFGV